MNEGGSEASIDLLITELKYPRLLSNCAFLLRELRDLRNVVRVLPRSPFDRDKDNDAGAPGCASSLLATERRVKHTDGRALGEPHPANLLLEGAVGHEEVNPGLGPGSAFGCRRGGLARRGSGVGDERRGRRDGSGKGGEDEDTGLPILDLHARSAVDTRFADNERLKGGLDRWVRREDRMRTRLIEGRDTGG